MKRNNFILLLAALIFASFTACSSDDDDPITPVVTPTDTTTVVTSYIYKDTVLDVSEMNLADVNEWKYFCFSEGKFVDVTDPKTSNNWDLGIRHESFKTNGGKSGNGKGAIYDAGKKEFDEVKLAPETGYTTDDSISVIQMNGSFPPPMVKVAGCKPLDDCFKSPETQYATYEPNNHVYIIKTADGKYVKFLATSFFNDESKYGHINCKYLYRKDGTTNLEKK